MVECNVCEKEIGDEDEYVGIDYWGRQDDQGRRHGVSGRYCTKCAEKIEVRMVGIDLGDLISLAYGVSYDVQEEVKGSPR